MLRRNNEGQQKRVTLLKIERQKNIRYIFLSGGLWSPKSGHCLRGILHQITFLYEYITYKNIHI